MQIAWIQIAVFRSIAGAFPLGEQLGDGNCFGGTRPDVIKRKFGVKSPAKHCEREQQDRHTNGKVAFGAIQLPIVTGGHSHVDSPSVYEASLGS
jgi:hypothetical protein